MKSFPALSHRAEEDLIKKSLRVFSRSWMVQKREMGSGSLHTTQGCKLSCCAWFGEICVPLGTLLNFPICLLCWPWYFHTCYGKRQHMWIRIHQKCWRTTQNKGRHLFQIYQKLGRNEKASSISHPFQIWTCTETHSDFQDNYWQGEFDLAIAL